MGSKMPSTDKLPAMLDPKKKIEVRRFKEKAEVLCMNNRLIISIALLGQLLRSMSCWWCHW